MADLSALTVQEATKVAAQIERHGVEHDRFLDGWGLPDSCIVVFRGGNITCYLPVLNEGEPVTAKEPKA